jgi:Phosphatidylinositol 3- and 4-kinase.
MMIRALVIFTLIFSLFTSLNATAGLLEVLSKGASVATGKTCSKTDIGNVDAIVNQALENTCDIKQPDAPLRFAEVSKKLTGDLEDKYFALLADQQVRELLCASDFAKKLIGSKEGDDQEKLVATKLKLARIAKQNLVKSTQALATNPTISNRVCPLDQVSLDRDYPAQMRKDPSYVLCKDIIMNRAAFNAISSSIPLSGVPAVRKMIEEFTSSKNEPTSVPVTKAYTDAVNELEQSAQAMSKTLQEKGGAGFDRTSRKTLMQDPALTETVVKKIPGLQEISCQADARYGSGAEALSTGVTVASLVFTGSLPIKSMGIFGRPAAAALGARSAGTITLNAMKTIEYAAFAADAALTTELANDACGGEHTISKYQTQNACVSTPSLKRNSQDDCILISSLAAIGWATVGPVNLITELGSSIKTKWAHRGLPGNTKDRMDLLRALNGETAPIDVPPIELTPTNVEAAKVGKTRAESLVTNKKALSDQISAARNSGDTAKYEATVKKAEKALNGKIVDAVKADKGSYGAHFVTYEDGTQAVWKPNDPKVNTANSEVAAYKIDSYLGTKKVPVTVKKSFQGIEGTSQLRVTSLKDELAPSKPDEIGFFDYLTNNNDRHHGNILIEESGEFVAIDNGLAFTGRSEYKASEAVNYFKKNVKDYTEVIKKRDAVKKEIANGNRYKTYELQKLNLEASKIQSRINAFVPEREVVDRLRNTTAEDWNRIVGSDLTQDQLKDLQKKQSILLKEVSSAEKIMGADALYPAGRFSPTNRSILQLPK